MLGELENQAMLGEPESQFSLTRAALSTHGTQKQVPVSFLINITNAFGTVTSLVATVTVVSGATSFIQDLPASQTVYLAHVIQLHVNPSGDAPFTYQWQKNGANISDDFRTSGSHSDTLLIGYADLPDSGNYQVIVTDQSGTTPSTMDALTVTTNIPGFFDATDTASDWSLQGTTAPVLTNNSIQLSAGLGSTARSAFLNAKKTVDGFTASFIYQDVSGPGGADGVTFCIQNQAANALGGAGGGLAYSGLTPSYALAMNIYASNTRGIKFLQNGTLPAGAYAPILPVDLGNNTDQVRVDLSYNGTVLTAEFTDLATSDTFTTNTTVNIPSIVGANTAWVGFTGADGGLTSTQVISWGTDSSVRIPLTATVAGNILILTWPASAGAYLQTSPSLNPPVWVYDNTDTFNVLGSNAQVIVPPSPAGQYFRLQLFP